MQGLSHELGLFAAVPALPGLRKCKAHVQISNAGIVLDWLDCTSWMDGVEHRLGKIPTREPLQRLLAGGIAGAFSRTGTPLSALMGKPLAARVAVHAKVNI